ncbi:hypothetical protein CROQUDRAFT_94093 [Cronartium quercuum f. sp. fusiforme G11]|uniref:Uncharacterized protein n=1 Tax=Cronartium quercuum f. sp. fusiforme G11 TaxID=708437 RepID=A0A9P6TB26_9BASI|nr:hypothetical protein CROQUDRAFT_94093 [Cronartium quercuum f. sp. fusiforme G11]
MTFDMTLPPMYTYVQSKRQVDTYLHCAPFLIRNVKCTVSFWGRAVSGNTTDDQDPALRPASETLKRRCAAVV